MPSKSAKHQSPKKVTSKFLKTESYDGLVNEYLKMYILEMDTREGFPLDDPFIDPTEDMSDGVMLSPEEMYVVVSQAMGEEKASKLSPEEIEQAYYYIQKDPSMGQDEDYEEECESAKQGCNCNECPDCQKNNGDAMLTFYGLTK